MFCRHLPPVTKATLVSEVLKCLQQDPGLRCLAVLDEQERPVGLVHQHGLLGRFANPFSHSLF